MSKITITVNDNGSLRIEGDLANQLSLVDKNGKQYNLKDRKRISLCRCGLTGTAPFCDGKHKGSFNSVCEAYDLPDPVSK